MIKYILTEDGIKDQETGANIPICEGNRHYQEYLEWISTSNTPVPISPGEDYDLVNDVWVLNETRETRRKQEELIQNRIRKLAVNSLKAEGKLPANFEVKDIETI